MFANTNGGGQAMGFPDVCQTPAGPSMVPVPYPNIADHSMGSPPVPNVLLAGAPAHNLMTEIPMTQGDAAGTGGGVASGDVMGSATFVEGSSVVMFGGAPATRLTSSTLQNGSNCQGASIAPSQTVVFLGS